MKLTKEQIKVIECKDAVISLRGPHGTGKTETTKEFIAERFEAYGLQRAGKALTYFQAIETRLVKPAEIRALCPLNCRISRPLSRSHR